MNRWTHGIIVLFLFSILVNALAEDLKGQLSRIGVTKPEIELLVSYGYTDITALQSLSLGALLQLGISGSSASLIKGFSDAKNTFSERSTEFHGKQNNSDLPAGWKTVEKSIQSIQTMQKDVYEKTSEFQTRRQTEIDKLVGQIKIASQEGDVGYQIGTAIIKGYDADTENLRFSIMWIEPLKQFMTGKGTELAESTSVMSPTEARGFPIGESFPLFADVRWSSSNNLLSVENVWLDRADLRELQAQAERERQQKLQKEQEAQKERERIEQDIIRKQSLAQEQARQNELLRQKQLADAELAEKIKERQKIEETVAKTEKVQRKTRQADEGPVDAIHNYYDAINRGDVDSVINSWLSPNRKKLESYIGGKRHNCLINNTNVENHSDIIASVLTDVTCDGKRWKVIISQKKIGERWKIFEIKNPS